MFSYSKRALAALTLAGGLCGAFAPFTVQADAFTVTDMLSFQRVGAPVASPDGKWLVFTVSTPDLEANKSRTDLWLRSSQSDNAKGNDASRRLTSHEASDNSPQWSADSRFVYFLSSRSGSSQLWRIAVGGGEAEQVSGYPLDINAYKLSPDNQQLLLSFETYPNCDSLACTADRDAKAKPGSGQLHERLFVRHWDTWSDGHLARLFIDGLDGAKTTNTPTLLSTLDADVPSKPSGGDEEFNFSPDGKTVYFQARVKGVSESWSTNFDVYEVAATGGALNNLSAKNPAMDSQPTVSPDGRYVAWLAMARAGFEADKLSVLVRDRQSGDVRDLSDGFDRSLDSLKWSPDSKSLLGTGDDTGQHSLFSVNLGSGKWQRVVNKGTVNGFDFAGKNIVYSFDDLKHPAELFSIAITGGKASQLTRFNADKLSKIRFGDYEQFTFKGANNDPVYGYVLKPADYQPGKKYPLAFLVHGGPQGSFGDHFHYRWNAQTYAGQGFAVVMIDFHGSTGYGQAFTDAISLDWGGKPFEDLQKGFAAAVAKYDFIDANRACAAGGSYGGFMMNWIAGNWSDRFRCIVNHAGIFDNRSMYYTTEELWFTEWENGGPQFANPASYEKHNPVAFVNNWKTPMLVIHGEKDFRVPYSQGLATFTALQRRGIPSQLLIFPDENHWILKPKNSLQWHNTVMDWMKRWTAN